MKLYKNKNGELEFYGFKQAHPLDFPFLETVDGVAAIIKNLEELVGLQSFYSKADLAKFGLYTLDRLVVEASDALVSHLEQFDPVGCSILAIFSELEDNAEEILRRKSKSSGRPFAIADIFRKSSPSKAEQVVRFRGIDFDLLESVETPAYFTNWAYLNFLQGMAAERKILNVLDMFSGSGAIGFSIAQETSGACVDCLDVNYHSVRSMRSTMEKSSLENLRVILSECFCSLRSSEKKYDLIVGNPPHMNLAIDFPRQINGRDPDFDIHRQFYSQAADFLREDGRIVLIENAHSNVLNDFYPSLPRALRLERVHRLPDGFWDVVVVSHAI